jgi:AraC-like DNA-binding protein
VVIVAHLPPLRLRYLREVVGPHHQVLAVETWGELVDVVRTTRPHVAVVDPTAEPATRHFALDAVLAVAVSVPVVVYTPLSPSAARAVQVLRATGTSLWLLEGIDDAPERLRTLLERFRAPGIEDVLVIPLLAALGAASARAPMTAAVRELFRAPGRFHSAQDLAAVAGMSRRWLNECLADAGVAPARVVVSTARVFGAYRYARETGCTVARAAHHLGYADAKSLRRHSVELTGVPPSAWGSELSDELCLARLASRLGVRLGRPLALVRSRTIDNPLNAGTRT